MRRAALIVSAYLLFGIGMTRAEPLIINTDSRCWVASNTEPKVYQLIVEPTDGHWTEQVQAILDQAGVERCKEPDTSTGPCLVTYRSKDAADTPDNKSQKLMDALAPSGAGLAFEYVVPNAPVLAAPVLAAPVRIFRGVGPCHLQPSPPSNAPLACPAPAAWPSAPYPSQVLTAVIDSGVDLTHPGLSGNMIPGQDFTCGQSNCNQELPKDQTGHGTNMAGVIAAHDDLRGVRGIAWNTHFIPLRAFRDQDSTDFELGEAIKAAVDKNVDVINASWSAPCPLTYTQKEILDAQRKDILFVTAVDERHDDEDILGKATYPAHNGGSNVIVVMGYHQGSVAESMDNSDWSFKTVDLAGPAAACTARPCTGGRKCYEQTLDSTSIATAYVSGAAALMRSLHPDWPRAWIKTQLVDSAYPESWLAGKAKTGARLCLDQAVKGPLALTSPVANETWSHATPHSVVWSKAYPSSLCQTVLISVSTDGANNIVLGTDLPNNGQATVRLDNTPATAHAILTISCIPDGLTATSAPFTIN